MLRGDVWMPQQRRLVPGVRQELSKANVGWELTGQAELIEP